jgi:hypothetical protein
MEAKSSLPCSQEQITVILSQFNQLHTLASGKCLFIKCSWNSLRGFWDETNTRGRVIVLSFDVTDA